MFLRLFFILFLSAGVCWAQSHSQLAKNIEGILAKSGLISGRYGIDIRRLENGDAIFVKNENKNFNPASSIKVLTAALALESFGPTHQFETHVYQEDRDLCIQGKGDPSLVNEELWRMAEEIRSKGVKKVHNIIADDHYFSAFKPYAASFSGDKHRAFTSLIGSLSANYNSIAVRARGAKLGKPAHLFLEPDVLGFKIHNQSRTTKIARRGNLRVHVSQGKKGYVVKALGNVGLNKKEVVAYGSVPNPPLYTVTILSEHLRRAGVVKTGKLLKGRCRASEEPIVKFKSRPLSQIVWGMNKFSNNFIAEMLAANLMKKHQMKNFELWALEQVKKMGVSTIAMRMASASGLSRANRISARALGGILTYAAKHPVYGPEFQASLSIGASDGTLKRRFRSLPSPQHLRAKSGSLIAVTSLVGLMHTKKYGWVQYVFLFNGQKLLNWNLRSLEERILLEVSRNGG